MIYPAAAILGVFSSCPKQLAFYHNGRDKRYLTYCVRKLMSRYGSAPGVSSMPCTARPDSCRPDGDVGFGPKAKSLRTLTSDFAQWKITPWVN